MRSSPFVVVALTALVAVFGASGCTATDETKPPQYASLPPPPPPAPPLAFPPLTPPPWTDAGSVLQLVNQSRYAGRTCGTVWYAPAPPLVWNDALARAAQVHANDMAQHGIFGHIGSDGTQPPDRISAAGYRWSRVGENVAGGQQTAQDVVATWLASPEHCANVMNPDFTDMGLARVNGGPFGVEWTATFGRRM